MNGSLRLRYRHGYGHDRGAMDEGSPAVLRGGAGLRTGDGADDPGRRTKAYPAALLPRLEMTHSPPGGLFHFGGQRNLSGMWRRLPRLSQNVHPQRQRAAQPDGVVDMIGVGVAGAGVEQDAQTITIEHQPRQK